MFVSCLDWVLFEVGCGGDFFSLINVLLFVMTVCGFACFADMLRI